MPYALVADRRMMGGQVRRLGRLVPRIAAGMNLGAVHLAGLLHPPGGHRPDVGEHRPAELEVPRHRPVVAVPDYLPAVGVVRLVEHDRRVSVRAAALNLLREAVNRIRFVTGSPLADVIVIIISCASGAAAFGESEKPVVVAVAAAVPSGGGGGCSGGGPPSAPEEESLLGSLVS